MRKEDSFIHSFIHAKLIAEDQHASGSLESLGPASVSQEVLGVRSKPGTRVCQAGRVHPHRSPEDFWDNLGPILFFPCFEVLFRLDLGLHLLR